MSRGITIPYLTGFDVKPSFTSTLGVVTFTDGTNSLRPNQLQCEAYGYTYDKASGTCSIFRFNTNIKPRSRLWILLILLKKNMKLQ